MKLSIMQPYFFPYIGYFRLLQTVDKFVFYDDVNFIKGGWINRNRLLLGGKVGYFTVPLSEASSFVKINSIKIKSDIPWEARILAQISASYSKAPYYTSVRDLVEKVVFSHDGYISTLAKKSVLAVADYLSISKVVEISSELYGNQNLRGTARVLDICRQEAASVYVNLPGGRNLYSQADFSREGMDLLFLDGPMREYSQAGTEFHSGLSIIDVLMFNSPEEVVGMLEPRGY
ncbi:MULTISPECIES: WbqC family protein [Delftia]|uniref:WbqC family protein n=1 Tax=Delftia TaxID=80865 RepID=UPI000F843FDF|nr:MULTISPECIES: WbqC family protein [Delftia]MDH0850670.1 WbqC family protein [Delftia tsuruhatensis]WEL98035.1 WbqC family protein [Delftia tsuruhatensis]WQM83786.1 WbqC family protein [Delftia tsuruhatensis]